MFAPIPHNRWESPPTHPLAKGSSLLSEMFHSLASSSVDEPIIATQLVASVSLLTQGLANIAWPNKLTCPIGLSVLLTAPSGSGKSVVSRLLMEPIHKRIRESVRSAGTGQRSPEFFAEDSTREALLEQLLRWPVVALCTDEGGQLAPLLRDGAASLAKLVDGLPLRHARVSAGRAELLDHRFMLSLAVQPEVLFERRMLIGASNSGVGLINRMTLGVAEKLPVGAAVFGLQFPGGTHSRYEERICALIDATIELVNSGRARATMTLSEPAQRYLIDIGAGMRLASQQEARYRGASEYVSRHSERVLRLAGALHVFQNGPNGVVDVDSLRTAREIDQLSIEAFLTLTKVRPKPSQAELDAEVIERTLREIAYPGRSQFLVSYLRRCAPNVGMTRSRFDRALPLLAVSGRVTIFLHERQDWLRVNERPLLGIQRSCTR